MKKVVRLSENKLYKIIKENIKNVLKEGIDFIQNGNERTVSVTNKHQNFVDTNNYYEPYVFVDEQRGFKTISFFQRKSTEDNMDSNPLLNALKGRKNWAFKNAQKDIQILLRNGVKAAHLLPKYDTLIMTPSNNNLNKIVFGYLIRIINHDYAFENFFEKLSANDVYEYMVDDDYINNNFAEPNRVFNDLDAAFSKMNRENDGVFSYKYLQNTKYREAIIQSIKVNTYSSSDLNYAEAINGKDVIIFDDTITTGQTISDSGKAICEMFAPKSLTFVTLFSALDISPNQEKSHSVETK